MNLKREVRAGFDFDEANKSCVQFGLKFLRKS